MKISLVTISFNQGKYLTRCIESVLSQRYHALEYIVVDPGSQDDSQSILKSYGSKITTVFEDDKGPADGLNNGFRRATGDIFGFINADDYLLPESLKTIAACFERNPDMHLMTGCGYIEKSTGEQHFIFPTTLTVNSILYNSCTIFQQGTFFSCDLFRRVGGFNPKNSTCWDMELFLRFLLAGERHLLINEKLGVFTIHPGSITGSNRFKKAYQEDRKRIFIETTGRHWGLWDDAKSISLRAFKKLSFPFAARIGVNVPLSASKKI